MTILSLENLAPRFAEKGREPPRTTSAKSIGGGGIRRGERLEECGGSEALNLFLTAPPLALNEMIEGRRRIGEENNNIIALRDVWYGPCEDLDIIGRIKCSSTRGAASQNNKCTHPSTGWYVGSPSDDRSDPSLPYISLYALPWQPACCIAPSLTVLGVLLLQLQA
uniref:Uncharacterized protein n=1 Tax=Oryza sativa subsp. japonica TaxID=39947 RepID=Q6ZJ51_ORYSJ|nr:hypothetical protein [Oryza sativa Japonica Group]